MTLSLPPEIDLGPITIAWHGLLTAVGLILGMLLAERFAKARDLDPGPVLGITVVLAVAGLAGARLFYLAQEDPGRLIQPWSGGTEGFAFYGALIAGGPAAALYLRLTGRPVLRYLDVVALAFPAGMAIGRVGDLINGEHYGPPTDVPWGVTYTDPASHAPETGVTYHSGALYEIAAVAVLAVVAVVLARRLTRPGDALWLLLGAYSAVRFVVFFWVRDVDVVGFGLRQAQWTSLALIGLALVGWAAGRVMSGTGPAPATPAGRGGAAA
jgi:phosphatidylglycerol:prolipoprotein diacylglycerol transferase